MTVASLERIVADLQARAESLARELLPNGHREGVEWVEATKARGGLGDSLKVNMKRGVWAHFAAGREGDMLDLVAYLRTNGDKKEAIRWARAWLGLDAGWPASATSPPRPDPEAEARRQAEAQRQREQELAHKRGVAQRIFLASRALILGTPADVYLRGRGIDLRRLGAHPGALRFHPSLRAGAAEERAGTWPALVAAITGPDNAFVAVHRTFLTPDGSGKAPIDGAKRTLGPYAGGCIRLWHGRRVDPDTGEIKPGRKWPDLERRDRRGKPVTPAEREVVVCEGIEDGLTLAMAMPETRILVAVSLSNMGRLILPGFVRVVTIAGDNDTDNLAADRGTARAIENFLRQGKEVRHAVPPPGVKDANALLQRGVG